MWKAKLKISEKNWWEKMRIKVGVKKLNFSVKKKF